MSQEGVENFKRGLDAYNRRDLDALMETLNPDVEFHPALGVLLGGERTVFRGHQGMRESIQEEDEALAMYEVEISEIRDLGNRVLAIGRARVRGKKSRVPIESPFCVLVDLKDDKAIRIRTYLDLKEAVEAAGLSEEPVSHGNVEIVRKALVLYTQRDFEALEALNHPDLEVDWSASRAVYAGVYRGWQECLRFYKNYLGTFEEVVIEPERFIESGDSVIVPNTATVRGRDGIQAVARSAFVFEVRGGRIARVRLYQETREALEAFGLSE